MVEYVPGPDSALLACVANFVTYANANIAALGFVVPDMTPTTTNQTALSNISPGTSRQMPRHR